MSAHIKLLQDKGFKIYLYHFDNEKAVQSGITKDYLMNCGVTLYLVDPGTHTEKVERWIRTVKERCRSIQYSLPFNITHRTIKKRLIFWCVRALNALPNTDQIVGLTPREIITGLKADYKLLSRVYFGAYAHIYDNNHSKTSTINSRTHRAICVGYSDGYKCSPVWFNIDTQREVVSSNYTIIPMPDEVINILNNLSDEFIGQEDYDYFDAPDRDKASVKDSDESESDDYSSEDVSDLFVDTNDSDDENGGDEISDNDDSNLGTDVVVNDVVVPSNPATVPDTGRRVTRSQTKKMAHAVSSLKECMYKFGYNTSYYKSRMESPEATDVAAEAEIRQLVNLDVGEAIAMESLSEEEKKQILDSFMFIKDKYDSKGMFTKKKARLVVNGSMQSKEYLESMYGSVGSPTAHMTSILVVLGIAASRNMDISTMDITGAFLRSDMDVPTFVRLQPSMAKIWIKFRPEDESMMTNKKELILRLKKSLYGCSQSPLLWSKNVESYLKELGFTQLSKDKAVYRKWTDKKLTIIVVYVDDFMVLSDSAELGKNYGDKIQERYCEVTRVIGDNLEYIGMNIFKKESGAIELSMFGFIESILKQVKPKRIHSNPAGTNLFIISGGDLLSEEEINMFHSTVYMLLYLAKRVRPDILLPSQFLTCRVKCPTDEDKTKLSRVVGYLLGSKDLVFCISGSSTYDLVAYVDASHAVHDDFKSHTGSLIVMGDKTIVHFKTSKQRLNTKASTESELVAASDSLPQLIYLKEFIEEILNHDVNATLLQDNTSTIALIKAGKPLSESTRHINIRFFYVHDYQSKGIVLVKHCGTDDMMADGFTKPLQGAKFIKFRNFVLGIS
jgi:hypothetical protein